MGDRGGIGWKKLRNWGYFIYEWLLTEIALSKVIFTQKDLLLQKYHVLYIIDYFFCMCDDFLKKEKNTCERIPNWFETFMDVGNKL